MKLSEEIRNMEVVEELEETYNRQVDVLEEIVEEFHGEPTHYYQVVLPNGESLESEFSTKLDAVIEVVKVVKFLLADDINNDIKKLGREYNDNDLEFNSYILHDITRLQLLLEKLEMQLAFDYINTTVEDYLENTLGYKFEYKWK